jgi:hypothetical protein
LKSQGIQLNDPEEMPPDPYILDRKLKMNPHNHKTKSIDDDKLRRYLEYDRKVLRYVGTHNTFQLHFIQIWRVAVNMFVKQSWAPDQGWSSSLEAGHFQRSENNFASCMVHMQNMISCFNRKA